MVVPLCLGFEKRVRDEMCPPYVNETVETVRGVHDGAIAARDADSDAAYAATYATTRDDVFRYLAVLTGNPDLAADLTSEAFARGLVASRAGRLPAERPLPWLLLTGRRLAMDRWRRLRTAMAAPRRHGPDSDIVDFESRVWISEICARLPQRQREVVALRYLRDLSDREIGAVMGLSESGVRSLSARAIAALRNHPEVWR